ncbi:MAG TPA: tRNA pseudouridine(54/55) synthase Pus10 [Candidatus Methanoperedenaceae archaeon]|nr:tRNA pseudouridine(54/55) synthase Pus10 [Candidatus Methanoperedenaceae archaeon]
MTILDTARKLLGEGPICDHCMGRQFAKLSTGLGNHERGAAIKLALAMQGDLERKEGDGTLLAQLAPCSAYARKSLGMEGQDEPCWVCGNIFTKLDSWAARVADALSEYEFNTFLIGTKLTGLLAENEEIVWAGSGTLYAEPIKTELNREVGKRVEKLTGKRANLTRPEVVALLNLEEERIDLEVNSIFIKGRYRKLVRGIPQTRWPCRECGGAGCPHCGYKGKMYEESVDELIKPAVVRAAGAEDTAFHGAGREDIDARMLGDGRPFIVEALRPRRRRIDLSELARSINEHAAGKIEVTGLGFATAGAVERLKETRVDKVYRMTVAFNTPVTEEKLKSSLGILGGATVKQRTPTRVLHRRADLERIRQVRLAELESMDAAGNSAVITVRCEGGLYVKELVSGDSGRTMPSLTGLLGIPAEVKELDVIKVDSLEE